MVHRLPNIITHTNISKDLNLCIYVLEAFSDQILKMIRFGSEATWTDYLKAGLHNKLSDKIEYFSDNI